MEESYHKIMRTIKSSQNHLHLLTCANMIAIFSMKYEAPVEELDLKIELDKKAQELGLIII